MGGRTKYHGPRLDRLHRRQQRLFGQKKAKKICAEGSKGNKDTEFERVMGAILGRARQKGARYNLALLLVRRLD